MAIFTKEPHLTPPEHRRATSAHGDGAVSTIAAGTTITGDIDTGGVIRIEGRLDGTIRSAREVIVGRQGEIRGDVVAQAATIGGRVEGILTIFDRIEVQGTGTVAGDIHTKSIVVIEGARINGVVRMEDAIAQPGSDITPVAIVR